MTRPHRNGILFAALIAGAALAVAWLTFAPTQLGGSGSYVITHGVSMAPRIQSGDLAIVKPADTYRVGDIAAYHSSALKAVVLHRIVDIDDGQYTFKGDNNSWLDVAPATRGELIGKLALRIPQGGMWLHRLRSPAVMALFAFTLIVAGGGSAAGRRRRRRRSPTVSRHAKAAGRTSQALRSLPPGLRAATAVTALAATLGVSLAAWAWSGPTEPLTASASTSSRELTFSYTATVPRSPAYDGTVVHSPDPVFRKLTNTVDLQLAYHGSPGTISVAVNLTTPIGWHATVPLAPPVRFTESRYTTTVHLDLNGLDSRAQAAAAATGLPASPLAVAVTAQLRSSDETPFTAAARFTLSPLQLAVAGDPKTLTTRDTVATRRLSPQHPHHSPPRRPPPPEPRTPNLRARWATHHRGAGPHRIADRSGHRPWRRHAAPAHRQTQRACDRG
jgi:signal peptidase I